MELVVDPNNFYEFSYRNAGARLIEKVIGDLARKYLRLTAPTVD